MQCTTRPNVIMCLLVKVIVMASTKWHILTFLLICHFMLFLWHLHNILMPFLWCFYTILMTFFYHLSTLCFRVCEFGTKRKKSLTKLLREIHCRKSYQVISNGNNLLLLLLLVYQLPLLLLFLFNCIFLSFVFFASTEEM